MLSRSALDCVASVNDCLSIDSRLIQSSTLGILVAVIVGACFYPADIMDNLLRSNLIGELVTPLFSLAAGQLISRTIVSAMLEGLREDGAVSDPTYDKVFLGVVGDAVVGLVRRPGQESLMHIKCERDICVCCRNKLPQQEITLHSALGEGLQNKRNREKKRSCASSLTLPVWALYWHLSVCAFAKTAQEPVC